MVFYFLAVKRWVKDMEDLVNEAADNDRDSTGGNKNPASARSKRAPESITSRNSFPPDSAASAHATRPVMVDKEKEADPGDMSSLKSNENVHRLRRRLIKNHLKDKLKASLNLGKKEPVMEVEFDANASIGCGDHSEITMTDTGDGDDPFLLAGISGKTFQCLTAEESQEEELLKKDLQELASQKRGATKVENEPGWQTGPSATSCLERGKTSFDTAPKAPRRIESSSMLEELSNENMDVLSSRSHDKSE